MMYRFRISNCLALVLVGLNCVQVAAASDVFKGREVYMRECVACHGAAGEGAMPGLPNFAESQTLFKTDEALMGIIRDGRGIMPGFGGLVTDEEIRDVTAYLRSFL